MGGYGSGRHSDQLKIEECASLDANQMRRDGCLNNGWSGTSRWWCNNVEVGSLLAYVCQRIICILLTAQEIPCQNK